MRREARRCPSFQVLTVELNLVLPDVYKCEDEREADLAVDVQPFERWAPASSDPAALGDTAEVYIFDEPLQLDALSDFAATPADRSKYLVWQTSLSDMEGCLHLREPRRLAPPPDWKLNDSRMPALVLLDALQQAGFEPRRGIVLHRPGVRPQFDCRNPVRKRNYLKCVIASTDLFNDGVEGFKSICSASFYAYLLKFRRLPPEGKSAKELKQLVNGCQDEDAGPPALRVHAAQPAALPAPRYVDADIAGDEPPPPLAILPPPPLPPPPDPPEGADIAGGGESDDEGDWPDMLEGMRLGRKRGKHDGGYSYHTRLLVQCPNAAHVGCGKSRSTALQTDTFGRRAALYFLGAWMTAAWRLSEGEHRVFIPSVADMREYRDS